MEQANRRQSDHKVEENILRDILLTINQYKKSIIITALIIFLFGAYSLYFKKDIYRSSAVIEVKSGGSKGSMSEGDFLGGALSGFGSANVDKDIEILKTFHVNNIVLNKVNFNTRYYIDSGFKQIEIYDNLPIEIKNLTVLDKDIEGYRIIVSPIDDGFTLEVDNTLKNKILHTLFNKDIVKLDDEKIYNYGKMIETPYFKLIIDTKSHLEEPLYFVVITGNRNLYESLKGSVEITQVNPDAPLIQIAFTDTMPTRANLYVDALAEGFIEQSIAEKNKGNNRIIKFIDKQLKDIKLKLNSSEAKLEKYRIEDPFYR